MFKGVAQMEGMERIRQSILDEAKAQADSIIKEAEQKAAEQTKEAARQAEALVAGRLDKAKVQADEAVRRMLSMAELEMKKEELKTKQQMIDKAFDMALERLKGLPKDQFADMVVSMLKRAGIGGDEEIIVSPADRAMFEGGLLNEINSRLGYRLKLSDEVRNIQGGFIINSRGIEINNSYETLLRMERERIETEIADILFQK
jgi:V/A-type H+-transporting ATPase subunit E